MKNQVVLAVAGASKTQQILDEAIAAAPDRALITTFTHQNLEQVERRLVATCGEVPPHITLGSWFSVLLSHGVRPYQVDVLPREGIVRGLNFVGKPPRGASKTTWQYWIDRRGNVWRDALSAFACEADRASGGLVVGRLEGIYDRIFIDEMQDLVGWDLDFLDLLFRSRIPVTAVGDPRQYSLSTNNSSKNKRFRGDGILDWLQERAEPCLRVDKVASQRCHSGICDFASSLFPELPALESDLSAEEHENHFGMHLLSRYEVLEYVERWKPQVLRPSRTHETQGLDAMNIGVSKGSTFDRVLIFPTRSMAAFVEHKDPARLTQRELLYVALTRAR